jgi:glycosyltransferase involved in cell wall biosynthesis
MREIKRICLTPTYAGTGGPASFQIRFRQEVERLGIEVTYDLDDLPYDAVLVIGGTRRLGKLWQVKRSGIPVVQRLDGFNWIHKVIKTGLVYHLRSDLRNLILRIIRRRLASRIVYQSEFVVGHWEQVFGRVNAPYDVVHNGVDLDQFVPDSPHEKLEDRYRIMMLEGSFQGGFDFGLKVGLDLAAALTDQHGIQTEVMVAGKISLEIQQQWDAYARVPVTWLGIVDRTEIPALLRSSNLYFSTEMHAACPNAVIEALACGLPVLAYDTGSLAELVTGDAGRIVPYGADAWKLEPPVLPPLVEAAIEILTNQPRFRVAARQRAVSSFDIRETVRRYLEAIQKT